tara:strand:- start:650 stop:1684 length:1035 start_codon:yes stop_codon:yes gene_type:complete
MGLCGMARNEQLVRQHKVLQILERSRFGRTLQEIRDDLVDELGLSSLHTRSVRRDLEALQAAGIDVDSHETQRGKVWKLGPQFRGSQPITATASELLALSIGRELLYPLSGTPFWIGIESFWSKITEQMPPAVWQHYERFRSMLYVRGTPAKSYRKQEGIIRTINRAIQQHRVVCIAYQGLSETKPRSREIEPYAVVVYHSSLYIVAAAREVPENDPERVRHWKLDRFRKAEATDVYFKPQQEFDLHEHLSQRLGIFGGAKPKNFRIHISPFAASWVLEDPWHPNQEVEKHRDGSITLKVRTAHEMDIIPRVLAMGTEAEILSPKSCRDKIAKTIREMGKAYKK